jgi:hypothetical protein
MLIFLVVGRNFVVLLHLTGRPQIEYHFVLQYKRTQKIRNLSEQTRSIQVPSKSHPHNCEVLALSHLCCGKLSEKENGLIKSQSLSWACYWTKRDKQTLRDQWEVAEEIYKK